MKEIPILFSTSMVKAILEGRKSQTRRLTGLEEINAKPEYFTYSGMRIVDISPKKKQVNCAQFYNHPFLNNVASPYGQPGDVLWVRENWQLKGWDFEEGTMTIKYVTGETYNCLAHDPDEDSSWLMDKVDLLEKRGYIKPDPANDEIFVFTDKNQPFTPSIHMPKEAARIWLQVESVRVERLQDISEQDAIAEGIEKKPGSSSSTKFDYRHYEYERSYNVDAKVSFRTLWEKINGANSWASNPFVWVVKFKVLSTTGKPDLQSIKAV